MGMSGTCSIFINVVASSRAKPVGSLNVPRVAYTSIIGIDVLRRFLDGGTQTVSQRCREFEHEVKWTVVEHHASDPTALLKSNRGHPPDRRAKRSPLPLEVRAIGGLGLVRELESVVKPGGLLHRVPDVFAAHDRAREDAALEDHVLVYQLGERLSRVVRDRCPPGGDSDRIQPCLRRVPLHVHVTNARRQGAPSLESIDSSEATCP